MSETNHKTVFVLDHTQYFGISSENLIDLDFVKSKVSAGASLPPISKSLWTSSVEAAVEYCRIVWDLFPTGKLIRFIVSDTAAHIVNTWGQGTQNITHVLNAMSMVGIPPRTAPMTHDCSVIHGLRAAIEALAEPTDAQKDVIKRAKEDEKALNKGRVICITSARDNASMSSLEDIYQTVLVQQNTVAATHKDLLNIDHCHLVIINLVPVNLESLVTNRGVKEVSPILTSEIHSISAADISNKLTHLILSHYELASTTVTGIPMKEEQNASSSANYDVEIFHAKYAHTVIFGSELILPTSIKEGAEYETVTLKWCTPRGIGASDLQPCLAQHRITSVDVTSRPSNCLINFLLNGRSVLLEMPRKTGGKLTSHLLSAHGGEIFIHTLRITRSCLEDLPSISEGGGGRVTNYRIPDFGKFMQAHKLVPLKPIADRKPDENLQKMRAKLRRHSRYWPLTSGTTLVYNMRQYIDPLLNLVSKDDLTDNDVLQCRQAIFSLVSLSTRNEQLSLPILGNRIKAHKKEELYKVIWTELEAIVQSSGSSNGHKLVLNCLRDCRARGSETAEKAELDQAIREIDGESSSHRASVIRATTDSPMSPPHVLEPAFIKKMKSTSNQNTRSLLDIMNITERNQTQKRLDFAGRLCTPSGQVAKLYPNLGSKEVNARETEAK